MDVQVTITARFRASDGTEVVAVKTITVTVP
jgi:hypothetical protein